MEKIRKHNIFGKPPKKFVKTLQKKSRNRQNFAVIQRTASPLEKIYSKINKNKY